MVGSKDLPPSTTPFFPNVFFRNQFRTPAQYPPKTTNLTSHVAIVTGSNTGLGFEAAHQLLTYNLSHLILAVRSTPKGEAAAKTLRSQHPKAKIEVWPLDMSSYDSIQSFARRVETELPRLDIAILNAGLFNPHFKLVPATNHEEDIQINYLSTILLAILLLPLLKAKAPPNTPGRLTLVNAAISLIPKFANRNERPLLPSFDDPARFAPNEQYCVSKLLSHMFLWKLVEYVSSEDVIVNLADPGLVKGTNLGRDVSGVVMKAAINVIGVVKSFLARTLEMGASTFLDSALVKGGESHGAFVMSYQVHPFASLLYTAEGKETTERLWEETMEELGFANVRGLVEGMRRSLVHD